VGCSVRFDNRFVTDRVGAGAGGFRCIGAFSWLASLVTLTGEQRLKKHKREKHRGDGEIEKNKRKEVWGEGKERACHIATNICKLGHLIFTLGGPI
jgi:hypothetical protein